MPGSGMMVFWHDFAPGSDVADYHEWHSKEHIEERVRVPGFQRGFRYVRVHEGGGPDVFMMYEVDDLSVLTSATYLERLNQPTEWTRRSMAAFANNDRTLCRVVARQGRGVAGFCLTVQLTPGATARDRLRADLVDRIMPGLLRRQGIVGAALLEGDAAASRTETEEKRIRKAEDRIADWVLIVQGYEVAALEQARDHDLSPQALGSFGPCGRPLAGIYRLLHCIAATDLDA